MGNGVGDGAGERLNQSKIETKSTSLRDCLRSAVYAEATEGLLGNLGERPVCNRPGTVSAPHCRMRRTRASIAAASA